MKNIFAILILTLFPIFLFSQYFGKNKPRYSTFDFEVKETPHFDIHYYLKNKNTIDWLAHDSEIWYEYISTVLSHELTLQNPIIFYSAHGDFQQTNAISSSIGVGTGGVTEGLKNRVIMPVTFTKQQTHQVLGHELVHAFQFNMVISGQGTSIRNMAYLPLWMVEGMAEYISIGRHDPFTAMWMRNAVLNENVPTFEKMQNPRYFPYRYGQTAWSYLAGKYGDVYMRPVLMYTARYGLNAAVDTVLNISEKELSKEWISAVKNQYEPVLRDKKEAKFGKTILSKKNSGRINVSPALSPNGKYVVYLSEKDLFSTDLFLADARNGDIIRKLSSLVKDGDLDAFNYLESSGTWSPNSKKFAFIAFSKGINKLVIKNMENGKSLETITIPNLKAFTTPVWSPDGKSIILTGSIDGQTDLFEYNLKRKKLKQLTDDEYAEIQPAFNTDGSKLIFSYDKRSLGKGRVHGRWTFDLAVMDYDSKKISILDIFQGANNLNPQFDKKGNVYFVSDRDGFRNLYKYDFDTENIYHMTNYLTGISGISRFSPMISMSNKIDRIVFSHYYGDSYNIISAQTEKLLNNKVENEVNDEIAGYLPNPKESSYPEVVTAFHQSVDSIEMSSSISSKNKDYDSKFELDYVGGGGGLGVGSNLFGTSVGLQGGVDLLFGDILGNHQLFTQLVVNGEIQDIGGQVMYINRKNKFTWGGGFTHVPVRTGYRVFRRNVPIRDNDGEIILDPNTQNSINSNADELNIIRIFEDRVSANIQLPFSANLRAEAGINAGFQHMTQNKITNYFYIDDSGFQRIFRANEKVEVGDEIRFNQYYTVKKGFIGGAYAALVGDNSYFGLTAPLAGHRYRLSAEYSYGVNHYYGFLADYRKYLYLNPVTLAFRGLGYTRYETEVNSVFPLFVGNIGFVRGYDFLYSNSSSNTESGIDNNIARYLGSKIGLFNFEVRLPFTGPGQLTLINTGVFFSDLNLFFDAGVAFDDFDHFKNGEPIVVNSNETVLSKPALAMSAGVSLRVNLYGALILEPYFAYPFRENSKMRFGLNLIPGW